MPTQFKSRNNQATIAFVCSHYPFFARSAEAFLQEDCVRNMALDAADEYLKAHPKATRVYLEIVGCFTQFRALELGKSMRLLEITESCLFVTTVYCIKRS